MPHKPDYHELTRMVRQLREALVLTRSPNFKFLTFSPPGHFYSPIPDIASIRSDSYRHFDPDSAEIAGLDLNVSGQLDHLERFSSFKPDIPWPVDGRNSSHRYHFDNIYFSYGDALSLFGLMREFRPQRVIEIGSGYSSAAMFDIDELFLAQSTTFTFIDPHAKRLKDLLKDEDWARVSILEHPVQDALISDFTALEKNDFLFIDSSHVSKAGSDVGYLVNRVLPHLAPGVIIHFHDIFWPFEYPRKWLKTGRAWNEAYLLLAFLQYNSAFKILFFNSYLEKLHAKLLRQKLPLMLRQPSSKMTFGNSSLWLRKSE